MRVKSCIASDGGGHVIQLSDEFGCVLRPKMISRFLKARGADERASVITYAFFHAFKFPDALSVHIKCKVEICRHGCLDHCQVQPGKRVDLNSELHHYMDTFDRKDEKISDDDRILPDPLDTSKDDIYDDIIQEGEGGAAIGNDFNGVKMALNKKHVTQDIPKDEDYVEIGPGLELPQNVNNNFFYYLAYFFKNNFCCLSYRISFLKVHETWSTRKRPWLLHVVFQISQQRNRKQQQRQQPQQQRQRHLLQQRTRKQQQPMKVP